VTMILPRTFKRYGHPQKRRAMVQ